MSESGPESPPGEPGRGAWIALLVFAYVLRIVVAIEYEARHPWADQPVIDEASYESWALEVAAGDLVGEGVFFQEPLYPYALALVFAATAGEEGEEGVEETAGTERVARDLEPPRVASQRQRTGARHAQAFLGVVLVALVHAVTRRAFGARAALVAGVGAAAYGPLLVLPALLLKPNLFLPVVLGLLGTAGWAARSATGGSGAAFARWFAVGALAGAAALLRGNALLALPLIVLLPVACGARTGALGRRLLQAGAVTAGVALLLLPVALRNQAVGGVFALSTSGAGTNVYGGNAPSNPYGIATEFPWVRGIPEHEAEDWRREAERREGRPLDPGEVSRFWLGELGASVVDDPLGHTLRLWRKLRLALSAYEVPDNHDLQWDARYLASLRLPWPGFRLWGTLGLGGLALFVVRRPWVREARLAWILAGAFFVYLGTIVLTVMSGRIRLMLVPLLLPFAGWMVVRLWDAFRAKRQPGPEVAPLVLAGILVSVPVLPSHLRQEKLDGRDMNHAAVLLSRPDGLAEAERLAQGLADRYPADPRVATLWAEVLFRRAGEHLAAAPPRREEAADALREALGLLAPVARGAVVEPKERFRARLLAGLCQLRAGGNPGAARRHLEAALAWDPSDRVGRLALANALALEAESGDPAERRVRLERARGLLSGLRAERDEPGLAQRAEALEAALSALLSSG